MRKYTSVLAVFVLLLGFVAMASAAPAEIPSDTSAVIAKGKTQITLGGELRFRGSYFVNAYVRHKDSYPIWVDIVPIAYSKNEAYYDYRVRLNLEAKVSPNTTGYIELESSPNDPTKDNIGWGLQKGGARGVYDFGNTKESDITIRQAWIQYQGTGLLGVPAGVKVGRQLIKLGYGLFFDHTYFGDDAILVYVQPLKELTLAVHTIKFL